MKVTGAKVLSIARRRVWLVLCMLVLIASALVGQLGAVERLRLEPAAGMTRAELSRVETVTHPKGILVLCPGYNGDGAGMVQDKEWQEFAKTHSLGLVGLSFASDEKDLADRRGYYCVRDGSGALLLQGLRQLFGRDLPLVLFGFSGGAHFVSQFAEWRAERVLTWCAYSASWWDDPVKTATNPPGLIICGGDDERLGASLSYFKMGRAVGKPWLWVEVAGNGHSLNGKTMDFVRQYFGSVVDHPASKGMWVDIDLETQISEAAATEVPSLSGWLPSSELYSEWKEVSGK